MYVKEARSLVPSEKVSQQSAERQRRNQGFADGLAGRDRRDLGNPDRIYGESYRRGKEKRMRSEAA